LLYKTGYFMKHILIPTDFSIKSLNTVHAVLQSHHSEEQLKITLFHLLDTPADISALMFRSMRNKHYEMVSEDFAEACEILQNRYRSVIKSMHIKFGFGNSVSYVRNFLEGEGVSAVAYSSDMKLARPSKKSIDVIPLLKKTGFIIEDVRLISNGGQQVGISAVSMLPVNEMKVPKNHKDYATQN